MAAALRSIGLPFGDVNCERFENEGFWDSLPLTLENGARRGTFRYLIQDLPVPVH